MERGAPTREELLALVQAYHHHRETHRRAAPRTHARDAAAARMKELDGTFERRLRAWAVDERLRQAWRNAFHHWSPPPLRPQARPRVLFRGRSDAGTRVDATAGPDGQIDIALDGSVVRRLPALSFVTSGGRTSFQLDPGQRFEETFDAPPEALEALRRWVADPRGEPPWTHAVALGEDGLIEGHFGLTARGRRALEAQAVPA